MKTPVRYRRESSDILPLSAREKVMENPKIKRVAQWLESHSSTMPLPPVSTLNTDCEASCEYTGRSREDNKKKLKVVSA